MSKVLILHGWQGSPAPHWQAWLNDELCARGHKVAFPQFTDDLRPQLEVWLSEAKAAFDTLRPDTVIAHSLGNILWFHLCNKGLIKPVKRLLLVAPPRDLSEFDALGGFFPVELPKSLYAEEVLLATSSDDPYLSEEESLQLARALNVKHEVFQNMGHINAESGYGPWPWVLEWTEAKG